MPVTCATNKHVHLLIFYSHFADVIQSIRRDIQYTHAYMSVARTYDSNACGWQTCVSSLARIHKHNDRYDVDRRCCDIVYILIVAEYRK